MTIEYHCLGTYEGATERLLTPTCPRCRTLDDASAAVPTPGRKSRSAMPMISVPTPLLFWTLLLATLGCSAARVVGSAPLSAAMLQAEISPWFPEFPQNTDDNSFIPAVDGRAAEVAKNEFQQEIETLAEEESRLPIPQALQADPIKRVGYMSMCHFKICNMGRKRNPYPFRL